MPGLYQIIEKNPECITRIVIEKYVQEDKNFDLTVRHVNRLRNSWGLSRKRGTPFQRGSRQGKNPEDGAVVEVRPDTSFAGLHFFDDWIEDREDFQELIATLKQAKEIYRDAVPEDSFPLLNHRIETLTMRFKALLYAPAFWHRQIDGIRR